MARSGDDRRSAVPELEALEPRTLLSALSIANLVLPEGNSGQKSFGFTVSLSAADAQDVTVHYRTADGTATAGADYTAVLDGLITIPAGQTSATAGVLVIGDTAFEPFETFTVELFNPSGADIDKAQATGVLLNDDTITGSLVAWGDNSWGQLNVPAGSDFIAVAAGLNHGTALRSDGSLAGWGDNTYGQAAVPAGSNFVAITAGYTHNLALRSDGSMAGWGINLYGQSTPLAGTDFVAVAGGSAFSIALRADGSLVAWGDGRDGQTSVPAGNNFVAIAAGHNQGLALRSDGSLAVWGGYLGAAPSGNDFIAVTAGLNFDLALRADGSLVAWGNNAWGQTNVPAGNDFVAISAKGLVGTALRADGTAVAWGDNSFGQTNVPSGADYVVAIAGGRTGMAVLRLTLLLPSTAPTFTEKGPPVLLDPQAVFGDPEVPDLAGWVLTARLTRSPTADDRLGIRNEGTEPGQIGVAGATVTFGGIEIGTFAGGTNGTTPLVVTLNASATAEAIQALIRNLTFWNVSVNPSTASRTVHIQIDDAQGASYGRRTKDVNLAAVNDPPAVAVPGDQVADEDTALAFSVAAGNAISVADPDAGSLPLLVTLTAAHGRLTLGGTANLQSVTGNGTATVTLAGSLAAVNAALNGLTFLPDADYTGPAGLQITANDQGASGSGGAMSDTQTVALTVNAVNDRPTACPQSVHTDGGTAVEIFLTGTDLETPAAQLTYTPTAPTHGTLTPLGDRFVYIPDPGYVGLDSFTFTVTDNGDPPESHANPGDLTSAPATVTIAVGHRLAFISGRAVPFADHGGQVGKVSLTGPGSGEIWFLHEGQEDIGRIILTGTTSASTLSITMAKSGAKTTIGPVDVQGSLRSLTAAAVSLAGDLNIQGTLGRLALDNLTGGTIYIGGAATARTGPTMTFNQVTDGRVVSLMPIARIAAKAWLDTDAAPDTISAPRLGTLSIAGDFQAGLTLSGVGGTAYTKTLTTAAIKGSAASTVWDVTGKVGAVTIGGTVGETGRPWVLQNATALASLTLGNVADADVTVGGPIGTIRAKLWLGGNIQATKITSITTTGVAATRTTPLVLGDFGASITLNNATAATPLLSMTVAGWMDGATITSTGPVGTIRAKRWLGGAIQATKIASITMTGDFGADVTLDNATSRTPLLSMTIAGWLDGATITSNGPLGAFTMVGMRDSTIQAGSSKIARVTVKGILRDPGSFFINSNISAYTLGTISIKAVQTGNSGQTFGISGHTLAAYSRDGKRIPSPITPAEVERIVDYLVELS